MLKSIIRSSYLEQRKTLPEDFLSKSNLQIQHSFFEYFDLSHILYIHSFLPILENKEINTRLILEKIWVEYPAVKVVAPKSSLKTHTMSTLLLEPETEIKINSWGIPEPADAQSIEDVKIDMVLVPLLCFDKQGHRVGYGGGFYDRFLSGLRKDCLKIGLSFFEPIEKITDLNEFDIPLDYCIEPSRVWKF